MYPRRPTRTSDCCPQRRPLCGAALTLCIRGAFERAACALSSPVPGGYSGETFEPEGTVPVPSGGFVRRVAHTPDYDAKRGGKDRRHWHFGEAPIALKLVDPRSRRCSGVGQSARRQGGGRRASKPAPTCNDASSGLWVVYGRPRHARSEGREGVVGGVGGIATSRRWCYCTILIVDGIWRLPVHFPPTYQRRTRKPAQLH